MLLQGYLVLKHILKKMHFKVVEKLMKFNFIMNNNIYHINFPFKSNLLLFFNINNIFYKFINYYINNITYNQNHNIYNINNTI